MAFDLLIWNVSKDNAYISAMLSYIVLQWGTEKQKPKCKSISSSWLIKRGTKQKDLKIFSELSIHSFNQYMCILMCVCVWCWESLKPVLNLRFCPVVIDPKSLDCTQLIRTRTKIDRFSRARKGKEMKERYTTKFFTQFFTVESLSKPVAQWFVSAFSHSIYPDDHRYLL